MTFNPYNKRHNNSGAPCEMNKVLNQTTQTTVFTITHIVYKCKNDMVEKFTSVTSLIVLVDDQDAVSHVCCQFPLALFFSSFFFFFV